MPRFVIPKSALAGLMLFGAQFLAPAQTISSSSPGITMTTGIVGVTSAESARLNVLNLQPVIPGVTAVACPVTLEFYDDTGALLKQLAVTNISPATAAALAFKPTVPSAATRAQIRAVVFTPTNPVVNQGSGSLPMPVPAMGISCNVMASLEITDDSTGATMVFTTDLRTMPAFRLLSVPVAQ